MSGPRLTWRRDPWFVVSAGVTAGVLAAALAAGFVWLPLAQGGVGYAGAWDAICSAAGLVRSPVQQAARGGSRSPGAATVAAAAMPSGSGSIGRGATLALGCTMCHGAHGQSPADTPSLAGHSAQAIHKQLADFRSGIRPSAVMAPLMVGLSDADMRDLAAYYASLPRSAAAGRAAEAAPRIVAGGAPLRGIAPCGACHGAPDASAGDAPPLDGQPLAYLRGQLAAFATGARRNDPGARMRNVAQAMTPEEIETASQFYAAKPR